MNNENKIIKIEKLIIDSTTLSHNFWKINTFWFHFGVVPKLFSKNALKSHLIKMITMACNYKSMRLQKHAIKKSIRLKKHMITKTCDYKNMRLQKYANTKASKYKSMRLYKACNYKKMQLQKHAITKACD